MSKIGINIHVVKNDGEVPLKEAKALNAEHFVITPEDVSIVCDNGEYRITMPTKTFNFMHDAVLFARAERAAEGMKN